jgi:predicted dehydrogenase
MSRNFTRRTFVRSIAYAGAALPLVQLPLVRAASPNGLLRYAAIGCDGMGFSDYHTIAKGVPAKKPAKGQPAPAAPKQKVQVVGLCDVDTDRQKKAAELAPDAPRFQDFRVMLDKLDKQIDAVSVAIPDHMHAYVALTCLQRGKHVYCQKPLTHTVQEARLMAEAAKKTGLITRMGNQIHSQIEYRLATTLLRDGVIGKIKEVHSWVAVAGHGRYSLRDKKPTGSDPVPSNLDWNLWLGVGPETGFVGERTEDGKKIPSPYHPRAWRDFKAYGSGALGDFGCHIFDPVFTALELTAPTTLTADSADFDNDVWPVSETIRYVFPGTKFTAGPTINVTRYDGGRQPDKALAVGMPADRKLPPSGSLFIGESGCMVLPHVGGPQLYPVEKFADFKAPVVPTQEHRDGWIDGCLSGKQPSDGFAYAGPLTETVQLGNIAGRFPGQKLQWDVKAMKFTNFNEANQWLTTRYRNGWTLPTTHDRSPLPSTSGGV